MKDIWEIIRNSARHFIADDCIRAAGALSFTTILGLVPLLAIIFISLGQVISNAHDQQAVQDFLIKIFSPGIGEQIQDKLILLAQRATQLKVIGLVIVSISVMIGLNTIDHTLNHIWGIKRCKRSILKLILYFTVLMSVPVLISISITVTSYLLSMPLFNQTFAGGMLQWLLINASPLLFTSLAFMIIYIWMPNIHVRFSAAMTGGVVAGILFETAKYFFLLYIKLFPAYDIIYGAFSALPLLSIWIYVSWIIALFGAELTFSIQNK